MTLPQICIVAAFIALISPVQADCDAGTRAEGSLSCQVHRLLKCEENEWRDTGQRCEPEPLNNAISVRSAHYLCTDKISGAHCLATDRIAALCNGRETCTVDVVPGNLCGDPCFGTVKNLRVEYSCVSADGIRRNKPFAVAFDTGKLSLACNP